MSRLAATEIRRLHRKVAQADRRIACAVLTGKVHPGSQDAEKRTVRLELGKTADGKPVLSPPVRWQQQGAGTLQIHATPKDGEQMVLQSPSGTIGGASLAVWGTYDKDTAPPSKATDAAVVQFGNASITMKNGSLRFACGATVLELTPGKTTLTTPAFAGVKG
ncbi:phage baseplate assembly protein V [Methylopila sp. 73B]|uniref:phage baseplate assembly protein V n=1 Tax=Methylopila sp. 73B TaxID=1120792 RepID=UPI00037EEFE2|nr:phage baseplate assembly protein V [Methylopila sp. 73B]